MLSWHKKVIKIWRLALVIILLDQTRVDSELEDTPGARSDRIWYSPRRVSSFIFFLARRCMEMRLNVEQEETGRQADRQTDVRGREPDLAKELWLSADRKTAARLTSKAFDLRRTFSDLLMFPLGGATSLLEVFMG